MNTLTALSVLSTALVDAGLPLDPALSLPLELDDPIEYLEGGDYVRVERLVRPAGAAPFYGTILRVRTDIQWALIEKERSGRREWFPVEELFLVLKASAAALTTAAD